MTRRPIDYTAKMQASEERRRQQEQKQREEEQKKRELRGRQAKSYGEAVLEIFERPPTIDELAGLLLDARQKLQANPQLTREWAATGAGWFRAGASARKPATPPVGTNGNRTPGQGEPDKGAANSGNAAHETRGGGSMAAAPPPQPRGDGQPTAPGTRDLLDRLAPDRTSPGTKAQGERHDGTS